MEKDKTQAAPATVDDKAFPVYMTLHFADGTEARFITKGPKPSKATGRMNAFYGGKHVSDDGDQFQVGCNVTQLS